MRKYPALYEELGKLEAELSDEIAMLEVGVEKHKAKQLHLEQELAGVLLLRIEIRQFLKDSPMMEI